MPDPDRCSLCNSKNIFDGGSWAPGCCNNCGAMMASNGVFYHDEYSEQRKHKNQEPCPKNRIYG